jgi:hypothetical protein
MPAPKKTNGSLSRAAKPIARTQKATPTTTNAAKTNLLKKKGRMDEAKALVKGGKGLVKNAGKEMNAARDSVALNAAYTKESKGISLKNMGRYAAVKAAQPYGEAVRTNARVQAQAKKAAKKTK